MNTQVFTGKHSRRLIQLSCSLLVTGILYGCGGGSGGGTAPPPPPSTPPPTGELLAVGPMPASGRFVVGDASIDINSAQVFVNGQPATRQSLMPGHIVGVIGFTDASGQSTASEIHFYADMIGTVGTVDQANSRLTVMGQPVTVESVTAMTTPLQNFTRGEVVQVSGYRNANGETVASRIDYSVSNHELRLIGDVTDLDIANFQFQINDLLVDYSQALVIDVPGGQLGDGQEILITGGLSFNGVFQVTTIENIDRDLTDHVDAEVRIEGRITDAASGEDFSVNGYPVLMGGNRDYRNGSDADIVIGAKVSVEGRVLDDGSIQVYRVWFL